MRLRHDIAICMFVVNQTGLIESKSNKAAILYSIISFTECILHCSKSKAKHAIKSVSFTVLQSKSNKATIPLQYYQPGQRTRLRNLSFLLHHPPGRCPEQPSPGLHQQLRPAAFFYEIWGRIFLPPIQIGNPGVGTRN
jgi:hypothetical protein